MEKLFFTAIAVIAFSGSAMARTVEIKKSKSVIADWTCAQQGQAKLDRIEARMGCLSTAVYNSLYRQYMDQCQN